MSRVVLGTCCSTFTTPSCNFMMYDDAVLYYAEINTPRIIILCDILSFCRDIFVTIRSAEGGELECLTYAHENGCRWDERTCTAAARNQHLQCLTYLHENGCPWNYETLLISNGPCRRYAMDNNCPKFS